MRILFVKDFRFLLILVLSYGCNKETDSGIRTDDSSYEYDVTIPMGGNAHQTSGVTALLISEDGVSQWDSSDDKFSVFVYADVEKSIRLDLNIGTQEAESTISVTANDVDKRVELPTGEASIVTIGTFDLIKGYNEFSFRGWHKSGPFYASIKSMIINYNDVMQLNYVENNDGNNYYWGRRGPSVHMTYAAPSDRRLKWFYNEMTIPVGQDRVGSFFMANGFGEGYFGIQVNSETERRVLFSVWSPYDAQDPKDIPEAYKVQLLKKGQEVVAGEFGNEGSGGQSYLIYDWSPGRTYKFLNSVSPNGQGNTVYSAYFMDPEVGQWELIASFLRPQTDTWYTRPHSFLENFLDDKGYLDRSVRYGNQWMWDVNNESVELTNARFTGDNVAQIFFRRDFSGGIQDNAFFLKNGGFFNADVSLLSEFNRPATGRAPVIDFEAFPQ